MNCWQPDPKLTEHERQARSWKGYFWVQEVRLWGCGHVSPAVSLGQCEDKWKTHFSVSAQTACTGSGFCREVPSHWVNSQGTWHNLSQSLGIKRNREWHAFHFTAPWPRQDPVCTRETGEIQAGALAQSIAATWPWTHSSLPQSSGTRWFTGQSITPAIISTGRCSEAGRPVDNQRAWMAEN